MALRDDFPPAKVEYMGGLSDGWCYETNFAGATLQATFEMIKTFLEEEGYGDIPLPADAEELLMFKIPTRNRQILMFEDNGYVHNPIKILFPPKSRIKNSLILKIYNELAPDHFLKFHNKKV
jgi:hypothetical protein